MSMKIGKNISRRISSLSPEQAEKKRAIDRDNQRHCRAKKEARIRSLEAEVEDLKQQLEEARAQLQQYQRNENATTNEELNGNSCSSKSPERYTLTRSGGTTLQTLDHQSNDVQQPGGPIEPTDYLGALSLDLGTGFTINSFTGGERINSIDTETEDAFFTSSNFDVMQELDLNIDGTQLGQPATSHLGSEVSNSFGIDNDDQKSQWRLLPLHTAPTNELDEFIYNTTRCWRASAILAGQEHSELNEPSFPSIASLLNRTGDLRKRSSDLMTMAELRNPLSSVVTAHVFRSPIKPLIERVAFLYHLSHLIRWLVCGNKSSFESMPSFMWPTDLQKTVPHPAWIDAVIWPEVRDELIRRLDAWDRFQDFRRVTGQGISVNWPYTDASAFLASPDEQLLMLNPLFETHIRKPENWTINKEAAEEFPFLKPYCGSAVVIGGQ